MKKHIDASILFIYLHFSICFLSTVFYSFVYNSIPVLKFKFRSVVSGIIIQTFPMAIHRRLHCNYKLSIIRIPEEGWFGQPKYSTLKKQKHSTLP